MATIKVTNTEGQTIEQEVDGDIDFKAMGLLKVDEVDQLAARKVAEGRQKAEGEYKSQVDDLTKQLEEAKANAEKTSKTSGSKDSQINALTESLNDLKVKLENMQSEAKRATRESEVSKALAGFNLIDSDGARKFVTGEALNRMNDEGQIVGDDGVSVSVSDFFSGYFSGEGKAFVLSNQNGGSGQPPANGGQPTKKISEMTDSEKAEYRNSVGTSTFVQHIRKEKANG